MGHLTDPGFSVRAILVVVIASLSPPSSAAHDALLPLLRTPDGAKAELSIRLSAWRPHSTFTEEAETDVVRIVSVDPSGGRTVSERCSSWNDVAEATSRCLPRLAPGSYRLLFELEGAKGRTHTWSVPLHIDASTRRIEVAAQLDRERPPRFERLRVRTERLADPKIHLRWAPNDDSESRLLAPLLLIENHSSRPLRWWGSPTFVTGDFEVRTQDGWKTYRRAYRCASEGSSNELPAGGASVRTGAGPMEELIIDPSGDLEMRYVVVLTPRPASAELPSSQPDENVRFEERIVMEWRFRGSLPDGYSQSLTP